MKKVVALLCALLLVISISSAVAEVQVSEEFPEIAVEDAYYPLIFEIDNPELDTYSWYLERLPKGADPVLVGTTPAGFFDFGEDTMADFFSIFWDTDFVGDATVDGKPEPQQLRIQSSVFDEKTYKFYVTRKYDKQCDSYYNVLEKATWYPENTVCSFGPNFRKVDPKLTKLWYMFTPIDLSKDGTQEFELVAGNVYVIGKVFVTVAGDEVTVTYKTTYGKYGHIYMKSEYLNFFPDLASVSTVVPEEIGVSNYAFGQKFSIANDLGGDTNVLMFIRNVATFRDYVTDYAKLTRFWPNIDWRVEKRDAMLAMMDQKAAE